MVHLHTFKISPYSGGCQPAPPGPFPQPLSPKPADWACCNPSAGPGIWSWWCSHNQPGCSHNNQPMDLHLCHVPGVVGWQMWRTRPLAAQCKRKCCTAEAEEALLQQAVRAHHQHCLRLESMAQRGCMHQKFPSLAHKDQLHTPSSGHLQSHTSQAVLCSSGYTAKQDLGINIPFLK